MHEDSYNYEALEKALVRRANPSEYHNIADRRNIRFPLLPSSSIYESVPIVS